MSSDDRLLSPAQVARRLAISARTVRAWLEAGELPGRRVRGRWYVRAGDLDAWAKTTAPRPSTDDRGACRND